MTRLFVFLFCFIAAVSAGSLRAGHFSPTAPSPVKVYFDGVFIASVSYGDALSPYITVTNTTVTVDLYTSNNEKIASAPVPVGANDFVTLVALSDDQQVIFRNFVDSLSSPDIGAKKARVRFLFALKDQPANFLAGNNTVFTQVGFAQPTQYVDLDSGSYKFTFTYGNTTVSNLPETTLTVGYVYTFVGLSGRLLAPAVDANFQRASVRVAHASPDAPAVNVVVGTTTFSNLAFTQQTSYSDVVPGDAVPINVTAGGKTVLSLVYPFQGLKKYSIFAYGFADPNTNSTNKLTGAVFQDDTVPADYAVVNVLNFVPDAPSLVVSLGDGAKNLTSEYGVKNQRTLVGGTYTVNVYAGTVTPPNPSRSVRRLRRRINGVLMDLNTVLTSTLTFNNGTLYYLLVEGSNGKYQLVVDANSPSPSPSPSSSGLSGGAIAGIVIACVVGSILIIGIIVYFWRRTKYSSIP